MMTWLFVTIATITSTLTIVIVVAIVIAIIVSWGRGGVR